MQPTVHVRTELMRELRRIKEREGIPIKWMVEKAIREWLRARLVQDTARQQ